MISVKTIIGTKYTSNCYIIHDEQNALIIDPGGDLSDIHASIKNRKVHAVLCTHAHYDHIINVQTLKLIYDIPFYLHHDDKNLLKHTNLYSALFGGKDKISIPTVDVFVYGNELIDFYFLKIYIIHTPGHTPGSICIQADNYIFTGDLIFKGKIGRIDLPGGNKQKLKTSLEKILNIENDLHIFPGHGRETSLYFEKNNNNELNQLIQKNEYKNK